MRCLVLGANGRTGRLFIDRAIDHGMSVTAIVRSTDRLSDISHDALTIESADATNAEELIPLMSEHDAIISTLGPRSPSKSASSIYSKSGLAISEAMQTSGVTRVIVTSSALLFPNKGIVDKALSLVVRPMIIEARRMEARIVSADLDWTIVRFGFLTNESDDRYCLSKGSSAGEGRSIPRAAVAKFLIDELITPAHKKTIIGLGKPQ
ncbi:MAG: SDR family oxidoreductase [Hyphomonas sp.]